jgi:hypothetical protein
MGFGVPGSRFLQTYLLLIVALLLVPAGVSGWRAWKGEGFDYPVRIELAPALPLPSANRQVLEETVQAPPAPVEQGAAQFEQAIVAADAEPIETPARKNEDVAPQDGMLPISFDLADARDVNGAVVVTKKLELNGRASEPLTLRVMQDLSLLVQPRELRARLQEQGAAIPGGADRLGGDEYLSFAGLREMGMSVRYDPVADAIVISTSG